MILEDEEINRDRKLQMASTALSKRVAVLEAELATLKNKIDGKELWWERIAGTFENDPIYEKAMKLGRQYRQSQRPRPSRKRP